MHVFCICVACVARSLQLSHIRVEEVPKRQAALEEKAKMVADTQATVDKEKAAQMKLQAELDHLRSLEPKVRGHQRRRWEGPILFVCVRV